MRLALCLILALMAPAALAGPAIAVVAAWVAEHYLLAQIIVVVAFTVYGTAQQKKAARRAAADAKSRYNSSLQDRTVTQITSEAPFVYIYGRARVGSTIVAMFTTGDKDQYKWLVCIHAAHECDGFEALYINGKDIGAVDADGYVTGGPYSTTTTDRVTTATGGPFGRGHAGEDHSGSSFDLDYTPDAGTLLIQYSLNINGTPLGLPQIWNVNFVQVTVPYTLVGKTVTPIGFSGYMRCFYTHQVVTPRVRWLKHLGAPGQTVDTVLNAALPDKWLSTATLDGFCYSVVMLDLYQPEFQSGVPGIEPLLRGKLLFDPRDDSTIWNQNNSLGVRDYLLSEMCDVPEDDIPDDLYVTAANVCDESETFGARYTMNGAVSAAQDQKEVLRTMAESMAGTIVSTTWEIMAGKYVAPVAELEQSDIIGALAINPGISDADAINGVRGQFISPENLYVPTDFTPYQNSTYVTVDGGDAWADITYPWTDEIQRVHNLTRIEVEDQRNAFTMKADFSLKAWARKVGERITFNSDFLGQVDKIFRITDKTITPGGMVTLSIKEDAESIWDFADTVNPDDTPNTNFPNPFVIDKITGLELESGTDALLIQQDGTVISRIHATWVASITQAVFTAGLIEIEWYSIGGIEPYKITVSGSDVDAFLSPVVDGDYYDVRVRAYNPYLNLRSDWTQVSGHLVIGKTEPPSDVEDFAINGTVVSWTAVDDVDLAGYILKFHYGVNTDWNSATVLYDGVITETPYDLAGQLPYGPVTLMIKAIDTSGNLSDVAGEILTDLGDPVIDNVVQTTNYDPTFAGTKTNCSVSGGDLVADALDSFYGTDDQSFYGADGDSFYEPGTYAQMIYETDPVTITLALVGSTIKLDIDTLGDDLSIEYSFDGAPYLPWPGQLVAILADIQFRITIGAGAVQGKILTMALIIDAPDIIEVISNLVIASTGTIITYTSSFTAILAAQATLQVNSSGARSVLVTKSSPLSLSIIAINSAGTAVNSARADITLQGY